MMFHPKQLYSIKNSTARLNIWDGSVRSGKTYATYFDWIHYVHYGAPGLKVMVGKTLDTLRTNVLQPMQDIFGENVIRWADKGKEIYIGKHQLKGYGANDERAETKIRGGTFAGAYGDEISLYAESFFKMLLSRLSVRGSQFFGTTNPDSPYHYLNTEYLQREGELNLKRFHFHIDDNTFLDPQYVADLKKEYTGLWYKRFIDGLWVMAEGAIYDMFDTDIHVTKEEKRYENYIVGVDYGTHNPCVFVLLGFNSPEEICVCKEYFWDSQIQNRQKTDREYVDDLVEFVKDVPNYRHIIIDPSASSFLLECAQRNLRIRKADNSVLDGIKLVSKKLQNKHLTIFHNCANTIKEHQSYVWDDRAQKRGEDKPLKQADHSCDALRYGIYTEFKEDQEILVC